MWNYGAIPQTYEDPKVVHPATGAVGDSDPIGACVGCNSFVRRITTPHAACLVQMFWTLASSRCATCGRGLLSQAIPLSPTILDYAVGHGEHCARQGARHPGYARRGRDGLEGAR